MNILYDHQTFTNQKYGGISRLFCEVARNLAKDPSNEITISIKHSDNVFLKAWNIHDLDSITTMDNWLYDGYLPGKKRLFRFLEKMNLVRDSNTVNTENSLKNLSTMDIDVFHPTYYDDYYLDKQKFRFPVVITVFDMIHELFPEYFPTDDPVLRNKKRVVEYADRIIAISESTKNDLARIYGINKKKIEVIHLASSLNAEKNAERIVQEKYLLFVGDRFVYKNFGRFVAAVSPLVRKYKLRLILAGGGSRLGRADEMVLKEHDVFDRTTHVPITYDGELESLYSHAELFVFPSLYEGFGIPILESMAMSCPVACSRTSSFPEVAGDAAVYFNPMDVSDIRAVVEKVLESSSLRAELAQRGIERNKMFNWEKTAAHHGGLYRCLIN